MRVCMFTHVCVCETAVYACMAVYQLLYLSASDMYKEGIWMCICMCVYSV